ncbi:thioredoxin O2, mitochondrial-like [Nicotiana tabacum]|uniref:Thioredoxin O2, mitochondrial-like n=2 Tax=Nicotiana tabacum TaxID=4097 RepID=A0A1S4CXL7_TOBAC|nr:PREDICTED: thioredoxin O2, mitochondrial-like [Nicotiana tabacum]
MRGISVILRRLVGCRPSFTASGRRSSELSQTLMVSSAATVSYSTLTLLEKPNLLPGFQITANLIPDLQSHHVLNHSRNFSSPSSSGPSNIVSIESEEQFNTSLRKVQDESLPAIFYFTAVWCGPCRLLSPVIGQLSEKYPHVTTYKVDIDKEGLGNALSKLNIHSVPTLHFFQNGKKTSEVIGADVQRLKDTMEELYK